MDLPGIEPGTPRCKRGILPLDYRPLILFFNKNNYQFYFEPELVFNIFVILFSDFSDDNENGM